MRNIWKLSGLVLFLAVWGVWRLSLADFYIEPTQTQNIQRNKIENPYIVHALGELDGENYLNCKKCFLQSYAKGFRYFEADFMRTSDGKLVLFHDKHEERFSLPVPFTEEEFFNSPMNNLGLMNIEHLADLMIEFPDWYLVTDIKGDNAAGLHEICSVLTKRSLNCAEKVIPQIYEPEDLPEIADLNFKRIIYTIYRYNKHIRVLENIVRNHPEISVLTIPKHRLNEEFVRLSKRNNIDIFVHTLNDEPEIHLAFNNGAFGVFTDSYFPPTDPKIP